MKKFPRLFMFDKKKSNETCLKNNSDFERTSTLFLRNMSHRIDTDMLGRISRSSNTIREIETTTSIPDFVKQLFSAGEQYASSLENVIEYYNAINGSFVPISGPILIRNIISDASFEAKNKMSMLLGVKPVISTIIDTSVPTSEMIGDGPAITRCLQEIIYNGLRHDEKLHVSVHVCALADDPTTISFSVQNHGERLTDKKMNGIFEPFSTSNKDYITGSGIGLGLAKCKAIIGILKGSIDVSWTESKGTIFRMNIPLKTESKIVFQQRDIDISYDRSVRLDSTITAEDGIFPSVPICLEMEQPFVLVVDDSMVARKQFQKMLIMVGVHVDICEGPLEALEQIKHQKYDMICLDIIMPIMSGITCANKIREGSTVNKEANIAIITADNSIETRSLCALISNSILIPKPVRRDVLYRTVYQLIINEKKREWMRRRYNTQKSLEPY